MSILIAVPAQEWIWTESALALIHLTQGLPPKSSIMVDKGSHSISAKRNSAVERALESDTDYILFCDSDMRPTPAALTKLLSCDCLIVSALCFTRIPPYQPAFKPLEGNVVKAGVGLVEAAWTGMAFTLIHTDVFSLFPQHRAWFEHSEPGKGEDIAFCEKARAAGMHIYVDTDVLVPHIGVVKVDAHTAKYLSEWTA